MDGKKYKCSICNTLSHALSHYVLTEIGSLQLEELDYGMIVTKQEYKIQLKRVTRGLHGCDCVV